MGSQEHQQASPESGGKANGIWRITTGPASRGGGGGRRGPAGGSAVGGPSEAWVEMKAEACGQRDGLGVRYLARPSSFPTPDMAGLAGSSHRGKEQAGTDACRTLR